MPAARVHSLEPRKTGVLPSPVGAVATGTGAPSACARKFVSSSAAKSTVFGASGATTTSVFPGSSVAADAAVAASQTATTSDKRRVTSGTARLSWRGVYQNPAFSRKPGRRHGQNLTRPPPQV